MWPALLQGRQRPFGVAPIAHEAETRGATNPGRQHLARFRIVFYNCNINRHKSLITQFFEQWLSLLLATRNSSSKNQRPTSREHPNKEPPTAWCRNPFGDWCLVFLWM